VPIQLIRANALDLPLADGSVDLVVTSPPYFGLRSYQDGGEHYAGQIGDEATPTEFVDSLIDATREMVRVLKPSGSIWVNLGDKFSGARAQTGTGLRVESRGASSDSSAMWQRTNPAQTYIPRKSLMGIPWRYAIRCIDDLGLILRAEVCWSKPNALPESVTDRVRRSHETWFHFTKSHRYFAAIDGLRTAHTIRTRPRDAGAAQSAWGRGGKFGGVPGEAHNRGNPLGALPGSVWTIPTEPLVVPDHLGVDHYAAFPMEWPRRLITGWSPAAICTACGEPRAPRYGGTGSTLGSRGTSARVVGHKRACPDTSAPSSPGVVLDPFGGTGTTALVADALGRHGISVDMSADYLRIAQWRTTDPRQRAKAAQRDYTPPPPLIEGQAAFLFAEETE
jgi:DNA modification methylase